MTSRVTQTEKVKVLATSDPLQPHGLYSLPDYSVHGISQARILKGSHSLLQGIFPTQGAKLGLLHCRQILYHLSLQGTPHKQKWYVLNAYLFSINPWGMIALVLFLSDIKAKCREDTLIKQKMSKGIHAQF